MRSGLNAVLLSLVVCAGLVATEPAPAAAQAGRQAQQADTTLTPEQRALARLRLLGAAAIPDSLRPRSDSITPQTVNVQGRQQATLSPMERDSIMLRLLEIQGYAVTEYRGGQARFNADSSRLLLRENAQVARDGNQLAADSSITYDERLALACGYGQPVLQGADMRNPVVSDTVCYDIERQLGRAPGATTRVEEGAQWNVRCDAYFVGDDLYCHDALFTDCNEPFPHQHYHFAAKELKVVRGNVMVARNLTMNFEDVPVFWLPFMVQSLSRGRRSGVLTPRFGVNDIARTNSNYSRRIEDVGVYWAINEYMGAELALDWFSNNWTGLRGSLDYNFRERFLTGGLTLRQFWREEGGRDMTIATRNNWEVDERTRVNVTGSYATSADFVQSRSLDPQELNRSIDSNASINRRFDWGTMELGASRKQFLHDNTVDMTLPNLSVTKTTVTLLEALPGEERWYSNLTWSGGTSLRAVSKDVGDAATNLNAQSNRNVNGSARHSLSLGNFSLAQNLTFTDQRRYEREFAGDSIDPLPGFAEQRGNWSTSLSYQQSLIGSSTFTPGVTVSGDFIGRDTLGALVHAPARIDFNASLRTDLFGFWPGIGAFETFRHRLSPHATYNYSPAASASPLQQDLFGASGGIRENNRITVGVNQTWEAKYRSVETDAEEEPDTMTTDVAAEGGAPRRRQQVATVMLLSLQTDAVTYDFIDARTGHGIQTTEIGNTVQSDLLRGLQLSFRHDLFRQDFAEGEGAAAAPERTFAPHLSRVAANFSLNGNSWLFRILRLGSGDTLPAAGAAVPMQPGGGMEAGPATDMTQPEDGMIGTSRRDAPGGGPRGAVGAWNATFNYTLTRPRETQTDRGLSENQMVSATVSFQPTVNWGLNWQTGYSFTTSAFSDHRLTLTRTLHDWDANFSFVKAQNGNFSFQFGVHLRANPDIKVDYSQSDMPGVDRMTGRR